MTRGIYLDMVSAEDYDGSLLGKEIVPNLLHYESDFLAVFPKAKMSLADVFRVINDVYRDGERMIGIQDDAGRILPAHAYRFIVLDP